MKVLVLGGTGLCGKDGAPLLVQLRLGYATDLFIDMTKATMEFGVRLTSHDEYIQKVLVNAPVH